MFNRRPDEIYLTSAGVYSVSMCFWHDKVFLDKMEFICIYVYILGHYCKCAEM